METEFHVKSDDKKKQNTENIQELYYENQELKIVNKKYYYYIENTKL
jgi:hypothetical protein